MTLAVEWAIIGGTGVYDPELLEQPRAQSVETPYGTVEAFVGGHAGVEVAFLPRHGRGHSLPPHRIPYRANLWALRALGVRACLATAACGSLRADLAPGGLALCDQFLDFTRSRASTFFDGQDGQVHHADMTDPYCPRLRAALAVEARGLGIGLVEQATYVCTEGPRFETPAEIRAYARLGGDLVGMTGVPEVVLAREAGLCYASVAVVTNFAAGLAGRPLTHAEVVEAMGQATAGVRRLLLATVAAGAAGPCDRCPPAPAGIRAPTAGAGEGREA